MFLVDANKTLATCVYFMCFKLANSYASVWYDQVDDAIRELRALVHLAILKLASVWLEREIYSG